MEGNSLQKHAQNLPKPKGRAVQKTLFKGGFQAIDDSFLEYIDDIRENIAKAFKRNNNELDSDQLTEAVQKAVDRLVFIRFLEDKLIETENHVSEWRSWKDFVIDCRKLDAKYNGVVFKKHFIDQQHFAGADERLFIDICADMSNLNSPYDFNYIPIHILGSIYERFLGKVVRATDKRVFIEEKPEVRKAGGVYYTPKYIVDYIVKNTIGVLIKNKTPKEIAAMHFADIACGSGSFLIGVYDYLLDYHKKYFIEKYADKTEINSRNEDFTLTEYRDGIWQISLKLKQEILLNNIYGVDIDYQATEVTQLSLFLKMLEDETVTTTKPRQGALFSKVLPDLTKNIVCGNSLIGFDIMNGQLFEDEELKKLNPMDFESAFPKIMRGGGFDAIVGNPPYVNIENLDDYTKEYFFRKFSTCKGRTDIYIPFIEKDLGLLKEKGLISYIIPYAFTNQNYGAILRKLLVEKYFVKEIVDTSNYYVFKQAMVKNITITIQKSHDNNNKTNIKKYLSPEDFAENIFTNFHIEQNQFLKLKETRFETKSIYNLFPLQNKIRENSILLENICLIAYGARLNHKSKDIGKEYFISNEFKPGYKPFMEGKNINRYQYSQYGWLNYTPMEHYNSMFPELFENEKLVFINVVKDRLRFAFDDKGFYNSHTVINCVRICDLKSATHISAKKILKEFDVSFSCNYSLKFLLGILNSKLITWYFNTFLSESLHFYPNDAKSLPIPQIDFKQKEEKQKHDSLSNIVIDLITSKKQLQSASTDRDIHFLENKCASLDRQIDTLVYKLYNLNEDEIRIIEQG